MPLLAANSMAVVMIATMVNSVNVLPMFLAAFSLSPAPIALAIRTVVPIARPMMTTVNICIICAPLDTAVVPATSQYCPMTNKSANP